MADRRRRARERTQARRARPSRFTSYLTRHAQTLVGSLGRLWRQPFASLMTIAVIGIALALPAALHLLVVNGKALAGRWDSPVEVSVFLRQEVSTEAARSLARRIETRADVGEVVVVPAEEALAQFRELSGFGAALDALDDNPLPATLIVRPAPGYEQEADVGVLSAALRALSEVDLVQEDIVWLRRFNAILDIVRRSVTLAAVLLAAAVAVIVGNTIRLDIQNRRDEIEIVRLIGAGGAFIRRPFLYSGLWYGTGGGLVALMLIQASLWLLGGPVEHLAGLYASSFRLTGLERPAVLALVGGGAALGLIGSWAAAARHMRAIEPR